MVGIPEVITNEPVLGGSAARRRFAAADIQTIDVGPAERRTIEELTTRLCRVDPGADPQGYVLKAQMLAAAVPEAVRVAMLRFRHDGDPRGGLLLRGLPTGTVPPTPEEAEHGVGLGLPSAGVLSLMAGLLGEQFGFLPELSGRIVQDILPVRGFEDTQHSISSRSLLELHCETAFAESRPDFVGLMCLRADTEHSAATLISPAHEVLARLSPGTVAVLREPRFATTVDGSFLRGSGISGPIHVGPIRVLEGSNEHPRLRCDFAETSGLDEPARRALAALYEAADATARGVRLLPGDLLFVDNHSAFHGRTPFTRLGDGRDRWLLRTFIARDLARSVASRPAGGRIVDIDYRSLVEPDPQRP